MEPYDVRQAEDKRDWDGSNKKAQNRNGHLLISPLPRFSLIRDPRLLVLLLLLDALSLISWFRRIIGVSSIGSGIMLSFAGFSPPAPVPPAAASPVCEGATVYLLDLLLGVWYNVDGRVAAAGLGGVSGFGADASASSGSPKSSKSSNCDSVCRCKGYCSDDASSRFGCLPRNSPDYHCFSLV
jgi:hypothetical protein